MQVLCPHKYKYETKALSQRAGYRKKYTSQVHTTKIGYGLATRLQVAVQVIQTGNDLKSHTSGCIRGST